MQEVKNSGFLIMWRTVSLIQKLGRVGISGISKNLYIIYKEFKYVSLEHNALHEQSDFGKLAKISKNGHIWSLSRPNLPIVGYI